MATVADRARLANALKRIQFQETGKRCNQSLAIPNVSWTSEIECGVLCGACGAMTQAWFEADPGFQPQAEENGLYHYDLCFDCLVEPMPEAGFFTVLGQTIWGKKPNLFWELDPPYWTAMHLAVQEV